MFLLWCPIFLISSMSYNLALVLLIRRNNHVLQTLRTGFSRVRLSAVGRCGSAEWLGYVMVLSPGHTGSVGAGFRRM